MQIQPQLILGCKTLLKYRRGLGTGTSISYLGPIVNTAARGSSPAHSACRSCMPDKEWMPPRLHFLVAQYARIFPIRRGPLKHRVVSQLFQAKQACSSREPCGKGLFWPQGKVAETPGAWRRLSESCVVCWLDKPAPLRCFPSRPG